MLWLGDRVLVQFRRLRQPYGLADDGEELMRVFRLVAIGIACLFTHCAVRAQEVEWTQLYPTARYDHAMAHDSARGVTVMFGGDTYGRPDQQTWEWNATGWIQRRVSGPSARYRHAMAYDSARGVTVLFGGWPAGG